jgi:hypothetical protein
MATQPQQPQDDDEMDAPLDQRMFGPDWDEQDEADDRQYVAQFVSRETAYGETRDYDFTIRCF